MLNWPRAIAAVSCCALLLVLPAVAQAIKPKPGRYVMDPGIGGEAVIQVNKKRTAFDILSLGFSPAAAPNSNACSGTQEGTAKKKVAIAKDGSFSYDGRMDWFDVEAQKQTGGTLVFKGKFSSKTKFKASYQLKPKGCKTPKAKFTGKWYSPAF